MKQFTELYMELDQTTRTSEKLEALKRYFSTAPPADAIWAAYLIAGRKIGRTISSTQLRNWTAEVSELPAWLVDECYHFVGDLSETLSLLVPSKADEDESLASPPPLHEVVEQILKPLGMMRPDQQRAAIVELWPRLTSAQRLVFHKLISQNFRVGVSKQMMFRALAEVAGVETAVMAHRLAGNWTPEESTMRRILCAADSEDAGPCDPTMPFPFMLAHPLGAPLDSLGAIADWLVEWKWDGIRAQLIVRGGKVALWSRGDELVSGAFPEIIHAAGTMIPDGTVLDGEILAWDESAHRPLSFAKLQRRLNRKNVELSFWPDVPVTFLAFDLLEFESRDLRSSPLLDRRGLLVEKLGSISMPLQVSRPVESSDWIKLENLLAESRDRGVEGLMLKRLDSKYDAGRPTGLWWKLKVQPFTVDAVLIAAQSGHGRRAGLLTDYTFGVWDDSGAELVPVAKAYSGLTDEEILQIDRFARQHTLERFGPVHVVEPLRVFELGFEAIQRSDRHKSGLAVRFPRMLRMRDDKKPKDADTLATLRALLAECEARG